MASVTNLPVLTGQLCLFVFPSYDLVQRLSLWALVYSSAKWGKQCLAQRNVMITQRIAYNTEKFQSLAINNIPGSSYPIRMIQILGVFNFRDFNWDTFPHRWTILRKTCLSSQILTIKMHIIYSRKSRAPGPALTTSCEQEIGLHVSPSSPVSALTPLLLLCKMPYLFYVP